MSGLPDIGRLRPKSAKADLGGARLEGWGARPHPSRRTLRVLLRMRLISADTRTRRPYISPAGPSGFLALEKRVSEGPDTRKRRLLFRCKHRGIREMDFVLGRFADAELDALDDAGLAELEGWLEIPDQQMFAWVNGSEQPPGEVDTALFRRLRAFHGVSGAPK
jgi:antitoxin CptB